MVVHHVPELLELSQQEVRTIGCVTLCMYILPVGPDARGVRHDVGDVGLLVRGVEEVGEGAARVHRHVLAAVRLGGARAGAGLLTGARGTLTINIVLQK